jgi:tetratricopeptide (TPR) repeat protein
MEPDRGVAVELARRAVWLDPNDAGNHWVLSHVLAYERHWAESDAEFAAAIELDPNHADAWAIRTEVTALGGQAELAIEQAQRALRLNPYPTAFYYWELGLAQYAARQYEAAVETLRKDIVYRTGSRRILAASLAQLGRIEEAQEEGALFMASNPLFTISHWIATQPIRDDAVGEHFAEGYRKAGLPE